MARRPATSPAATPPRAAIAAPKAPRILRQTRPEPPSYHPGPPLDGDAALDHALALLAVADPETVGHLLEIGGRPALRRRPAGFAGLAAIVTAQQVSTASAAAIFGRLEAQVTPLDAETLLATPDPVLRGVGLSLGKIRTLRAVAEAIGAGRLSIDALATMDAEQAQAALVSVKGIGPWTADVFLLFCLGHPDAWPAGDLALQEAARIALTLEARPSTADLHRIGDRWRPHRGVAAHLLWAYYRAVKRGRSGMSLASP